jgi:hypothetical protein
LTPHAKNTKKEVLKMETVKVESKKETEVTLASAENGSFIEAYVDYSSHLTDAPTIFQKYGALFDLSVCVGRTKIKMKPSNLYPDLWVILLGQSTLARKTVSIRIATEILPEAAHQLPQSWSPEGLQEALSESPEGYMVSDEAAGFLESIKKKSFMVETTEVMCKLFDCPDYFSRQLRRGKIEARNVYISLLGATTLYNYSQSVTEGDIKSGFWARFIPVLGEVIATKPRQKWTAQDDARKESCKKRLQEIYAFFHAKTNPRHFEFEDDALEYLGKWEEETLHRYASSTEDAELSSPIVGRLADYAVKFSALYEVSNLVDLVPLAKAEKILITKKSVETACETASGMLEVLTTKVLSLLNNTKFNRDLEKFKRALLKFADKDGWAKRADILPYMNMKDVKEFDVFIHSAIKGQIVELHNAGATYYRLSKLSTKAQSLEEFVV